MFNFGEQGGFEYLMNGSDGVWALPLGSLVLCLRHLGLSGYQQAECMAIENELMTWQEMGGFNHQDEARRLRATLHRLLRLTESYSATILDTLFQPSLTMGLALGMSRESASGKKMNPGCAFLELFSADLILNIFLSSSVVFSESEIRSSIAFQSSKLASLLLKASSKSANMPPWQVIMPGKCLGTLVEIQELSPKSISNIPESVGDFIAVVEKASGDEELVSLGSRLKGVILLHDIPHLSHLGVRARQEKVPFIATDEKDVNFIQEYVGEKVVLTAASDGVDLKIASGEDAITDGVSTIDRAFKPSVIPVKPADELTFVSLEDAQIDTCGSKATVCKDILKVSHDWSDVYASRNGSNSPVASSSLFVAEDGIVIPFGCMERAIVSNMKQSDWINRINQLEHEVSSLSTDQEKVEHICEDIRNLICCLELPSTLLKMIDTAFGQNETLIVRSSANVEDLEGLSGAGLYESIGNIPSNVEISLGNAIKSVWASLFSRRAVLARAACGIPSSSAAMAVLIQRQIAPDFSFVLHTRHPLMDGHDVLLAEIAPGQGETLASGTRGSGWRFAISESEVISESFANFDKAYIRSGHSKRSPVTLRTVDYSRNELSCSRDARERLGRKLKVIGDLLERVYGGPQDIEGCIVGDEIHLVQSRPQP